MLAAYDDKTAYAQCIFSLCINDSKASTHEILTFCGKTDGKIVPAQGPTDFGWDPVFMPDGFDISYAEMPKAVKNTISHRFRSLALLRQYLIDNEEAIYAKYSK